MGNSQSSYRQRWQTLRSGRVARVAVAYAAAGWLLVQVASTMLMALGPRTAAPAARLDSQNPGSAGSDASRIETEARDP
jgi:hypothetical protein